MTKLKECFSHCCQCLNKVDWFPGLLTRVSVGWVFAESGWGKFGRIPQVVEFFQSLGIPAANIQAPFVAGVELIGGALLILGLLTRAVSVPLIGTMIVAILTAKKEEIEAFSDLFGMSEYLYIVLLVWLIFVGPGKASLDQFLKNKCCNKESH